MTPSSRSGAYMRKRPTRAGRPLRCASVGAVGFGDLWRIPDDVCAVVVAVPGFNVTDRVTNGGEAVVLVVGREVRDDGAVVEVCHMRGSLCCISPIADGQRQGRASCRLNPRAMRTGATRSHAQGARDRAWRAWRGPEWSGRTAAPQAGWTRRDLARPYTRRSAGCDQRERRSAQSPDSQGSEPECRNGKPDRTLLLQVPLPGRAKEQ